MRPRLTGLLAVSALLFWGLQLAILSRDEKSHDTVWLVAVGGKCLGAAPESLRPCHEDDPDLHFLQIDGSGGNTHRLQHQRSRLCLGRAPGNPVTIAMASCNSASTLWVWDLGKVDGGSFGRLAAAAPPGLRQCLGVVPAEGADLVVLQRCAERESRRGCHQMWSLVSARGLRNSGGRLCDTEDSPKTTVGVAGLDPALPLNAADPGRWPAWRSLKDAGQQVCLGPAGMRLCHMLSNTPQLTWTLSESHQLEILGLNICLESGAAAGDAVVFATCVPSNAAQQWKAVGPITPELNAFGMLVNRGSGLCLDSSSAMAAARLPSVTTCAQSMADNPRRACRQHWRLVTPQTMFLPTLNYTAQVAFRHGVVATRPIRLVCWVLTMPSTIATRGVAVNNTWGRSCDKLLFMSSLPFPGLDVISLPLSGPESRDLIWEKTMLAWLYVHDNLGEAADYFVKADDDTFLHIRNLRDMLASRDPEMPEYFGRRFWYQGKKDGHLNPDSLSYNSGGAGYIFSRETLRRFGQDRAALESSRRSEDVIVARILRNANVDFVDTRDEHGYERFIPTMPAQLRFNHLRESEPGYWLWNVSYYPARDGPGCCARRWIGVHYAQPELMAELQWAVELGCEGL